MINQSTVDQLKAMRLSAMAHELETQMQDSSYNDLGFEERLPCKRRMDTATKQ